MPWHSASLPKHFESYSAMQKKALQILEGVSSITCDRCGRASQAEAIGISEFTSIDFVGGYGSIFGDGSKVEVDLCQQAYPSTSRSVMPEIRPTGGGYCSHQRLAACAQLATIHKRPILRFDLGACRTFGAQQAFA